MMSEEECKMLRKAIKKSIRRFDEILRRGGWNDRDWEDVEEVVEELRRSVEQ